MTRTELAGAYVDRHPLLVRVLQRASQICTELGMPPDEAEFGVVLALCEELEQRYPDVVMDGKEPTT